MFIAVNASMYGMQQHNYSLLYYTHLNTPDSINTGCCQTSSPRTAEHGQRLCVGFHLNSNVVQKPLVPLHPVHYFALPLINFIRCFHAGFRCKNVHLSMVVAQWSVLVLSFDGLKVHIACEFCIKMDADKTKNLQHQHANILTVTMLAC